MKQSGEGDHDDVDDRREEKRGREHTRNYVSWVWDLLPVSFKRLLLAFHTFVYGKARTQSQAWTAVSTQFVDWKTFQNNCWEICLTSLATDRERKRESERCSSAGQHWSTSDPAQHPLAYPSLLGTFVPTCSPSGPLRGLLASSLNDPILISKRRLSIAHCGIYIIRRILRTTHFYIFSTRFTCCCCCWAFWGAADKRRWLLDANMTTILAFGVPQRGESLKPNWRQWKFIRCFGFWQGCCVVSLFRQRFVSLMLRN